MSDKQEPSGHWYWCFRHNRVEPLDGCTQSERLGPYPTEEAAEHWRDTVEARNKRWDEDDDS